MVCAEGRHGICRSTPRAPGICGMAYERNSLLWNPTSGPPRNHGLGPNSIQVWEYGGRCQAKITIRSVLHQERLRRPRPANNVPDYQDGAPGARSTVGLQLVSLEPRK